jgi:hypothetical protein
MASADGALGGEVSKYQLEKAYYMQIERDVFRLLGKVQYATKSLKGRLAVAQPPGATMAVTGRKFNTRRQRCKGATAQRLTEKRYFLAE